MESQLAPPYGPPLDVQTWVDNTGKRSSAHLEIRHDPIEEGQWVREYAEGRVAFRDPLVEQARQFAAAEQPAQAIIASRMALEIPFAGDPFLFGQDLVMDAMNLPHEPVEVPKSFVQGEELSEQDRAYLQPSWDHLHQMGRAMDAAFDTPGAIKQELEGIAQQSRAAIAGHEISAWTAAVNFFGEQGQLHAAGLGALELGAAYEEQGQTAEAIDAYESAGKLLKQRLINVGGDGDQVKHTAEASELSEQLITALGKVVRHHSASGSLNGHAKEVVKQAVYDLDDLGASRTTVMHGYLLLAKSSHFREKHFYKREATAIGGMIAVANYFANGGGILMDGPSPRRDRSDKRPPVTL